MKRSILRGKTDAADAANEIIDKNKPGNTGRFPCVCDKICLMGEK